MHIIGFKAVQSFIFKELVCIEDVVYLILTMFLLSYILKQYVDEGWSKLK